MSLSASLLVIPSGPAICASARIRFLRLIARPRDALALAPLVPRFAESGCLESLFAVLDETDCLGEDDEGDDDDRRIWCSHGLELPWDYDNQASKRVSSVINLAW